MTNVTATAGSDDPQRLRRRRHVQRRGDHPGRLLPLHDPRLEQRRFSVQDLAENHLDGEFYGSFPSGNDINGGDFVAELQAYHDKVFAPQTIIGTANAANGGVGGLRVESGSQRRLRAGDPQGRQPDLLDAHQPGAQLAKKGKGQVVVKAKHGQAVARHAPRQRRQASARGRQEPSQGIHRN